MVFTDVLTALNDLDSSLLLAVNGWHSEWADAFMYTFSGKLIWVPMYAAILYVVVKNFSWKVMLFCLLGIALSITLADQVGASLIRPLVGRLRPANLDNPLSEMVHVVNDYRGGRYGFPSCHAANSFALAFFLFYLFRNRVFTGFIMVWAAVNCYSRAYLGVHYPGDLLVGMLLGFLVASFSYWLFVKVSKYERPGKFNQLYVPMLVGGLTVLGIAVYALVV